MKPEHAYLALVVVFVAVVTAQTKFTSTWKSPDAQTAAFAGKKMIGLVISDDMSLRVSAEEALARELTDKGVQGSPAYRLIPREEIRDPEKVKVWFQKSGAAGVVVMRLVDLSKESSPSAVVWESGMYYDSFWNYYPYAWGAAFELTPARTDVKVIVEMLVFDLSRNKLLWGGTSQSKNPKDAQSLVKDIVDAAAEQMRKEGLSGGWYDSCAF